MTTLLTLAFYALKFYGFLSLIYFITTFQENFAYVNSHAEEMTQADKWKSVFSNVIVAIVFGGVVIIGKTIAWLRLSWKKFRAWYALAKFARTMTKQLEDVLEDKKGKS